MRPQVNDAACQAETPKCPSVLATGGNNWLSGFLLMRQFVNVCVHRVRAEAEKTKAAVYVCAAPPCSGSTSFCSAAPPRAHSHTLIATQHPLCLRTLAHQLLEPHKPNAVPPISDANLSSLAVSPSPAPPTQPHTQPSSTTHPSKQNGPGGRGRRRELDRPVGAGGAAAQDSDARGALERRGV